MEDMLLPLTMYGWEREREREREEEREKERKRGREKELIGAWLNT
jgi:hypothetical protein